MLTLEQCLGAHRPMTFVVAESDLEVLNYIYDNYKEDIWFVYSSSLASMVPLGDLIKKKFLVETRAANTTDIFDSMIKEKFDKRNRIYKKYIFLDSQTVLNDSQDVRKIKDILSRYQMDEDYAVNMLFISQYVCVPMALQRLGEVVFFDLPDEDELRKLSDKLVKKLELKKPQKPSPEVVNNLRGLTKFEVEQSYFQSYHIHKKIDLNFIRDYKKNAIAKTDLLSLSETGVSFTDIGGMDNLKLWIQKSYGGWTVEGKKFGLPLLKGLLLVGLSGCGKSMVMKAIGNEWGLPVVDFDPSLIFSSRVGDSEQNMRRVLNIVENMSPCILSIDEIEKGLAGMQSSTFSDSGVTARVIRSFLIWMQDCLKPVFVIATANNIQYLPPELINRFDETFFVNIPQSFERKDIFEIHIKRLGRDPNKIDCGKLAQLSEDLSGREIEQVLKEGMYEAYHTKKELSTEIIVNILEKKTNLITTMAEQLKALLKWVGWDDVKKDGIRARFASPSETFDIGRVRNQVNEILKDIEGKQPDDQEK